MILEFIYHWVVYLFSKAFGIDIKVVFSFYAQYVKNTLNNLGIDSNKILEILQNISDLCNFFMSGKDKLDVLS